MIRFELAFGLLTMALWVFCLVEVISSRGGESRNLGKVPWLLIVLFFPFAGSISWLVAGRPRQAGRPATPERAVPQFPEYDRPGRASATSTEDDEAFLRKVRERAEEQRRRFRAEQLAHEREQHEKLRRRSQERQGDQS